MGCADIEKNWSRSERVGLVDLAVAAGNQNLVTRLLSSVGTVWFLMSGRASQIGPSTMLPVYFFLQACSLTSAYGLYRNIPPEAPYVRLQQLDHVEMAEVANPVAVGAAEAESSDALTSSSIDIDVGGAGADSALS